MGLPANGPQWENSGCKLQPQTNKAVGDGYRTFAHWTNGNPQCLCVCDEINGGPINLSHCSVGNIFESYPPIPTRRQLAIVSNHIFGGDRITNYYTPLWRHDKQSVVEIITHCGTARSSRSRSSTDTKWHIGSTEIPSKQLQYRTLTSKVLHKLGLHRRSVCMLFFLSHLQQHIHYIPFTYLWVTHYQSHNNNTSYVFNFNLMLLRK